MSQSALLAADAKQWHTVYGAAAWFLVEKTITALAIGASVFLATIQESGG